ncbi:hypothetical protein SAMD00079811_35940 [Scytonema sp. HK-05]|nr:hypothetical protein SAMD00079811_35940 [Scytonema sp. HK-05]
MGLVPVLLTGRAGMPTPLLGGNLFVGNPFTGQPMAMNVPRFAIAVVLLTRAKFTPLVNTGLLRQ